jgi:ribosome-binding ATPase YchF (GTP1/OBG family)
VRQLRDFDHDLVLFDLGIVERRLDRLRKSHGGRTGGEFHELEALKQHLAGDRPLRMLSQSDAERRALAPFGLLSGKPLLVVLNVAEAEVGKPVPADLEGEQRAHGVEGIALCATLEGEIAELDAAEQPAFLESLGLAEPVRDRFIHAAYHLLDLNTFFTVGEDEVRAWTVHRGDKAPRAAGTIDPELERVFGRIEVTHYDELMAAGDKARSHLEGKDYVIRDGDLLRVRAAH